MSYNGSLFRFTSEDLCKFRDLIYFHTGNRLKENNDEMIKSRIAFHLTQLGIKSLVDYWQYHYENQKTEIDLLINALTTHHTAFFRERIHFDILAEWIMQNIDYFKKRHQQLGLPLTIWSAACSKGHEAYSLAMFLTELLNDYDLPVEIIGSDVDRLSVEFACNGVYPLEEVKAIPRAYLQQFWKKGTGTISGFAAVRKDLKDHVTFKTANLFNLDNDLFFASSKFDVVFLRNVLIYFTNEDSLKIVDALKKRLYEVAALVTGLSEPIYQQVKDFKNTGPCFYAKDSRAPLDLSEAKSYVSNIKPTPSSQRKYNILCVDDSPTILTLLKKIFATDLNCAMVYTAKNGDEAVKVLEKQSIDIMTLDIHMPVLDGIGFLKSHYPSYRNVPVVIVSSVSRTDRSLALQCLELGALDYVEKPQFSNLEKSSDEILSKVRTFLGKGASKDAVPFRIDAISDELSSRKISYQARDMVRIVISNSSSQDDLKRLMSLYQAESEQPLLLICQSVSIETDNLRLSSFATARLEDLKNRLEDYVIYTVSYGELSEVFNLVGHLRISLQFLSFDSKLESVLKLVNVPDLQNVQVLVSENALCGAISRLKAIGISPDEVTPITSFPSLSNEFFSNLRCKRAS